MIDDAEINKILAGHFSILDRARELDRQMREASDNRLWESPNNRWAAALDSHPDALPIRIVSPGEPDVSMIRR